MRSDIHLIDLNPRDSVTAGAPPLAAQCVSVTALEPARSIGAMVWASWGSLYFLADDLGTSGRDFVGRATSLYRLDIATGAVRRLTDSGFDLGEVGSDLSFDGDGVLVQVRERGRVRIARVSDAGEFTPLEPADVVATGQHAGGGRVVAVVFHSTSAGEGPHPVLLNVHGGPFAAYTVAVVDEFQVYADARYAVVFCNPRGAAGYGEDHARAIRRAMARLISTMSSTSWRGLLRSIRNSTGPDSASWAVLTGDT